MLRADPASLVSFCAWRRARIGACRPHFHLPSPQTQEGLFPMKKLFTSALLLAAATIAVPAHAQFAKGEDAVQYRQSAFRVLGHHFGRLGAMANGKMPYNAAVAAADGDVIAAVAKLPATGFVPGSESGHDTRALPALWKDLPKVKELNDKMVAETGKLAVAAKSGNLDQLKAAFGPAAQTCKACHDDYRKK
jgi:cytochrome c556